MAKNDAGSRQEVLWRAQSRAIVVEMKRSAAVLAPKWSAAGQKLGETALKPCKDRQQVSIAR
jgi:hypothetical protein